MDQVSEPQYSRPDYASKVPPDEEERQGMTTSNPDDHTKGVFEDHSHEKTSLISVMKNKAKDKMHKAKDKLKTMHKAKDEDNLEDEEERHDDQVNSKNLLETPTHGYAADGSYVNHGKPLTSFGVRSTRDQHGNSSPSHEHGQEEYDSFLKSTKGETQGNSDDLTSVPIDYSSPRAEVDAVMPPPVISPGSASDLGEQSSNSLGNIPEKPKEEDNVSDSEARNQTCPSSSSFASFGDTTQDKLTNSGQQKDLEAIERDSLSQELGDGSKETKFKEDDLGRVAEEPREENQLSFNRKSDRELPSDEADVPLREPEKGGPEGESDRSAEKADEADVPLREPEKGGTEGGSDRSAEKADEADVPLREPEKAGSEGESDRSAEKADEADVPLREPENGGTEGETDRSSEKTDEAAAALREPDKGGTEGESDRSTETADRELHSTEAGVTSRGSDGGSERPLRDPDVKMPVPQGAEFTEGMFSSQDANDLHDTANSSGPMESKESQSPAVSSRNLEDGEGIINPSNSDQDDKVHEEREEEQFFDPQLDESSLELQGSKSVGIDENRKFAQDASLDLDVEEQDDEGKKSVAGSFSSAADAVSTKVGYSQSDEPTASDTKTSTDDETTSGEPGPEREPAEKKDKGWAQWATEKLKNSNPHSS